MMLTLETYVRKGRINLQKLAVDPRARLLAKIAAGFFGNLLLSGASLAHQAQPFAMALVLAMPGWMSAVTAAGGAAGYLLFWGSGGYQGLLWLALAMPTAAVLRRTRVPEESPLLMSAIAGLIVAASGLIFQIFMKDTTSVPVYLLRVALGAAGTKLFELVYERSDPLADWLASGIAVLAVSQVAPFGFSFGFPAAGFLAASAPFPAAALAGLALDLAQLTATPMTAVLCLAYMTRMLPVGEKWMRFWAPGAVYLLVMGLCGVQDFSPFLGLMLGSGLTLFLPPAPELQHRRGETGMAQVRLELMAEVMARVQMLLLEAPGVPIDREALLARAQERTCGSCPNRKSCRERHTPLPVGLLTSPLVETASLSIACKKPGRMILELRRTQEQLRTIQADRQRQEEYRGAVIQQYQFLAEYLRQQSDLLPRRGDRVRQRYQPEAGVATLGLEGANGDRCLTFRGPGCRYYILLCDGMGTGLGAAQEGQSAASLLRQMLCAGFPAEHALRSLNSLLVLRGRAGAVTMDLAEIHLDSGRAAVYKWGAAPSYLLRGGMAEKIGTATPPPGLSITEGRETVERLSLRRGEVLIMTSDGVDGEDALRRERRISALPPGELAAKILEYGARSGEDDATVAALRLSPGALST